MKLATDPPVSEAQRKAMWAAAKGHSTLGIPQKVGKEFVGADSIMRAAGIAAVTPDGRALFLRRSAKGDHAGEWCFPGGGAEGDESPEQTAAREFAEETGHAPKQEVELIGDVLNDEVHFLTFRQPVGETFVPVLNDEHDEHAWAPLANPPNPLHPVTKAVLQKLAMDAKLAFDRVFAGPRMAGEVHALRGKRGGLAFDRASVRTYDRDGRLHVAVTNISKATVNPYVGHEIPDWESLGLEPDKIYKLLRDPGELEKSAPTFNNLPLLSEHVAVTADDHEHDLVVGSTGTDCEFVAPFLRNSLVLWTREGIDAVESEEQKELSCAYHYRADMTPGEYEGEHYDGVMRDIVGNHVAIVEEGRAGSDVVVGDSNKGIVVMAKKKSLTACAAFTLGALGVYMKPLLAKDAKIDLSTALAGLTSKNFKDKKAALLSSITEQAKDKLAKDASMSGLAELLDTLEAHGVQEDAEPAALDPNAGLPVVGKGPDEDETMDADPDPAKEFLKGKLSAEDMKAYDDLCAKKPGMDAEPDEEAKKKAEAEKAAKDAAENEAKEKDMVTKPAMDAAITTAVENVKKEQKALRDAEEAVRPYVGKLAMAHDSADAVYRTALTSLGVKGVDKIHPSAYPAILATLPKANEHRKEPLAADAAISGGADFEKRFPGAAKITVAG